MATLQRIRNHGVALLIIVGVAMLAFILGDLFTSGSSFFNRDREYVGEIEGTKIHYTEYESAVEQLTEVYKIESGRSDFDEETNAQIRNQVWQMMVAKYTLKHEADLIGLDITADELSELCIGEHPHQLITSRRAFYDENGQFNRMNLVRFLAQVNQDPDDATPEQQANIRQARNYWLYWENAVRLTAEQEKYISLLQNMITANNLDAKYAALDSRTTVDVDYVMQPYFTVADSLVKVTDGDIKALYEEHKPLYKQTPHRSIAYIAFNITPSQYDFEDEERAMQALEEEFRITDDIAAVVNTNSDVMYDGFNYSESNVPELYKDFAFGKQAKENDFMPLSFDQATNTYRMARLVKVGYTMPDSVKLKAISTQEGVEDQEIGWITEADVQKSIAEPAFAGKKGDRFTVAIGMGEQEFEIMDVAKATPKARIAIIERVVTPSSKTYSATYNKAKQFIVDNNNEQAFRDAAKEAGLEIETAPTIAKNDFKVADLKASRAIVRWAFEAKKEGAVSDVFECGDKYVVAVLTDIHDDEYRSLKDVEGTLRYEATNRKKAEYIAKQWKGATDLNAIATIAKVEVKHIDALAQNSRRFGQEGNEPKAVGTAFGTAAGQLSAPVQGNQGVIVLVPGQVKVAEGEINTESEIANLNARTSYSTPYQLLNQLEQSANIVDNRINFQ